jgi:hypothetical protein
MSSFEELQAILQQVNAVSDLVCLSTCFLPGARLSFAFDDIDDDTVADVLKLLASRPSIRRVHQEDDCLTLLYCPAKHQCWQMHRGDRHEGSVILNQSAMSIATAGTFSVLVFHFTRPGNPDHSALSDFRPASDVGKAAQVAWALTAFGGLPAYAITSLMLRLRWANFRLPTATVSLPQAYTALCVTCEQLRNV